MNPSIEDVTDTLNEFLNMTTNRSAYTRRENSIPVDFYVKLDSLIIFGLITPINIFFLLLLLLLLLPFKFLLLMVLVRFSILLLKLLASN
jgi:hypothetical protein